MSEDIMIGDKIVDVASSFGSTIAHYLGVAENLVDQNLGGVFSNPSELYRDLSTGTLDALTNKTASFVLTSGIILASTVIGTFSLAIACYEAKEWYYSESSTSYHRDVVQRASITALPTLVLGAFLLYLTTTELRQSGALIASKINL